jgi:hypothetical protein|nr:MAG TPA: Protein of unknown function (DUF2577) [Caudoviricetes sp.]
MTDDMTSLFDTNTLHAIDGVLKKGDRVELIPTKDGVRVIHIRRENVNLKKIEKNS